LLSFIDIQRLKNRSVDDIFLVSMAGLKDNVVQHNLKRFSEPLKAVLSVDNDNAGLEFIKRVTEQIKGVKAVLPNAQYKDWNEQLKSMRKTEN
jgi:hypothetical protein